MFHIESTAHCPRTPVLLLALAEAGLPFEIELRPDGYFEQNHGEPGPRFDGPDGPRIGLSALLETVRTLPALRPASDQDAQRVDTWFPKLEVLRAAMPRIVAAKRTGQAPAPDDVALAAQFVAELEASLETHPWVAGDSFSSADVALSFVGFLGRVGLAIGPRAAQWLARIHARPAWHQVVDRFGHAASLAAPP